MVLFSGLHVKPSLGLICLLPFPVCLPPPFLPIALFGLYFLTHSILLSLQQKFVQKPTDETIMATFPETAALGTVSLRNSIIFSAHFICELTHLRDSKNHTFSEFSFMIVILFLSVDRKPFSSNWILFNFCVMQYCLLSQMKSFLEIKCYCCGMTQQSLSHFARVN